MRKSICPGEQAAFLAGQESPTCWVCDQAIVDLTEMSHTTRGAPLCRACTQEIDERVARRVAGCSEALPVIINHGRQYVDL